MSTARAMALALYDAGYDLFPIPPGCKIPVVRWVQDWDACRFRNRSEVVVYWTAHPKDNIGINCGESVLLVIDLDSKDAAEAFARLWRECEGDGGYGCPIIKTRRGWHLYFSMPREALRNTESKLMLGVDTRAAGGMVVGPGSTVWHDSDGNLVPSHTYELISGDLADVPELPGWLERRLRAFQPKIRDHGPVVPWTEAFSRMMLAQVTHRVEVTLEGRRNKVLNTEAFRLRPALESLGAEYIGEELLKTAENNNLPRGQSKATIRSGLGANPWPGGGYD